MLNYCPRDTNIFLSYIKQFSFSKSMAVGQESYRVAKWLRVSDAELI